MRFKTGTTLVEFLRDAASDASSILAASTSQPEPEVAGQYELRVVALGAGAPQLVVRHGDPLVHPTSTRAANAASIIRPKPLNSGRRKRECLKQ